MAKALENALGIKFEREQGNKFFRSTLVQTLFSNGLNYDWFIQSIFISNPLLTSSLVIVHQMITSTTVDGGGLLD